MRRNKTEFQLTIVGETKLSKIAKICMESIQRSNKNIRDKRRAIVSNFFY